MPTSGHQVTISAKIWGTGHESFAWQAHQWLAWSRFPPFRYGLT